MSQQPPNLLFIMTDHQRADSLGMVQSGVEVTPHLNRLASESKVFTRAYNVCPLCVPARTSLATGKYPTTHGVVNNDFKGISAGDHKPIHQYLSEAGYEVAHIGVHHIRVKPGLTERVHFAAWFGDEDYGQYLKAEGLDAAHKGCHAKLRTEIVRNLDGQPVRKTYSGTETAVWPAAAEHFKDSFFAARAVEFLRAERPRPFALFVYLWAPHPPLAVPEPYASRFNPKEIELPDNVGTPASGEPPDRRAGVAGLLAENVSMPHWRRVWAAHLGLVNLADDAIGRVLRALDEAGHADDTLTVFTVDHGEHLGQHAMYQKMEMYEQAIRVPLIVHRPGTEPHRFDIPVSHLDVLPTLLDLCGIDRPGDLDGTSLYGSVTSGMPPRQKTVFSMYAGNDRVSDHRRAVIAGRFKYIYDPEDLPELYDLETDPLEMHNLAAAEDYAEIRHKLHAECRQWGETHGDRIRF